MGRHWRLRPRRWQWRQTECLEAGFFFFLKESHRDRMWNVREKLKDDSEVYSRSNRKPGALALAAHPGHATHQGHTSLTSAPSTKTYVTYDLQILATFHIHLLGCRETQLLFRISTGKLEVLLLKKTKRADMRAPKSSLCQTRPSSCPKRNLSPSLPPVLKKYWFYLLHRTALCSPAKPQSEPLFCSFEAVGTHISALRSLA